MSKTILENTSCVFIHCIDPQSRFKKTLESVGGNTGNIVFYNSLKQQLNWGKYQYIYEYFNDDAGDSKKAIMPSSTYLIKNNWLDQYIDIIKSSDKEISLCGLGTQAKLSDVPKDIVDSLAEEDIYFFKLIAERCKTFGVRGEFTAECLHLMGIKNIRIIGCPSLYKKSTVAINESNLSTDNILLNRTYPKGGNEDIVLNELMKLGKYNFIGQRNEEIGEKGCMFYDFDEWNKYIQKQNFNFCTGTRFHGNMMALRNGIPTVWIVHDWRTLELVRSLKLPYVMLNEIADKRNIVEKIISACDYSELKKNYDKLYMNYIEYLKENIE